jgi:hypothetical protein
MGEQATLRLLPEHTLLDGAYERVEATQDIVKTLYAITTTRYTSVAVVVIALSFGQDEDEDLADQSAVCLLENLRLRVRKTDSVFLLGHSFYFLLPGASIEGGNIVQDRLWEALLWRIHNASDIELLKPNLMTTGHSAYPVPQGDAWQCLADAQEIKVSFDTRPECPFGSALVRAARPAQPRLNDVDLPELARRLGVPYLSLLPRRTLEQVQQLVDPRLAQELHCYPLGRERGTLTVAMSDPQDRTVLDRLQKETGLHIFPVLTHPWELQTVLDQL